MDRIQSEVMSVSERLALFAHVMDGTVFLLVPAREKVTDAWLVPPEYGRYYDESQFGSAQTQLQTLASAYTKGDGFQLSRAANELRDSLRGLSPKIYPQESKLRLEYFYNHWDGFYRAAWCYGIALVLLGVAYMDSSVKLWISDTNPRPLKSEIETHREMKAAPVHKKTVVTYEYDPSMKIVVPGTQ